MSSLGKMSIETPPSDSLPPELLANIVNQLPFEDRKNGRFVSKYWRDVIDNHANVKFRIELNDDTVKWIKNLKMPKVECLWIHGLTTPLNSLNSFPKKIKTLRIGVNNSTDNFWNALSMCQQYEVDHLELENNHALIVDFRDTRALDFPSSTIFKSVKTLTMKVKNEEMICNTFQNEQEFSTRGWGLVLTVLAFPALKKLSFELDCFNHSFPYYLSVYVFNLLNMNTGVKNLTVMVRNPFRFGFPIDPPTPLNSPLTVLQLEKLNLHIDFQLAAHVTPLIKMENQQLKKLWLKHTNSRVVSNMTHEGCNTLTELIHRNSSSLEFISIKAEHIDLDKLQLENCRSLRTLKLNTSSILIPERMGRISHIKTFKLVRIGSASNVLRGMGNRVLEIFGQELEEFTCEFYNKFRIPDLERILRLPKIKKIVLTRVRELDPTVTEYCNNFPGIRAVLFTHDPILRPGRGTDYHFTFT